MLPPSRAQAQLRRSFSELCPSLALCGKLLDVPWNCTYTHMSIKLRKYPATNQCDSLSSQSGLRSRRDLLQDHIVLEFPKPEFDQGIPILTIQEVIVHTINDVVDGALHMKKR